jgi:hypothetical protein
VSRTLAPAPTDRSMWRRLLALAHPDGHGAHDWFVWASAFREHLAGDYVEPAKPADYHRPRRTTIADSLRVDFSDAYVKAANFDELTRRALDLAVELPEPYSGVLWALVGCYRAGTMRDRSTALSGRERRIRVSRLSGIGPV